MHRLRGVVTQRSRKQTYVTSPLFRGDLQVLDRA